MITKAFNFLSTDNNSKSYFLRYSSSVEIQELGDLITFGTVFAILIQRALAVGKRITFYIKALLEKFTNSFIKLLK